MERQRSAHCVNTGFGIRRFSNGDLRPAESQVNYKYVQMDVGILTDGLSPNIHRSMAIASILRFASFRLLRIIRFSIAWYHTHKHCIGRPRRVTKTVKQETQCSDSKLRLRLMQSCDCGCVKRPPKFSPSLL